jgi:hypothetical protein
VLGTLDTIDRVDDFARTAIPGTVSAPVIEPGEMLVYYEGSGKPTPRQLGLTVSGPDGARVSLKDVRAQAAIRRARRARQWPARSPASRQPARAATRCRQPTAHAVAPAWRSARTSGEASRRRCSGPGCSFSATVSVSTAIAVVAHRRRSHRDVTSDPSPRE